MTFQALPLIPYYSLLEKVNCLILVALLATTVFLCVNRANLKVLCTDTLLTCLLQQSVDSGRTQFIVSSQRMRPLASHAETSNSCCMSTLGDYSLIVSSLSTLTLKGHIFLFDEDE